MSEYAKVAYNYIDNNKEKLKEISEELMQDKDVCKLWEPFMDFFRNKDVSCPREDILCGIIKLLAILSAVIVQTKFTLNAKLILMLATPTIVYMWSQYNKKDTPMTDLLDEQIRCTAEQLSNGYQTIDVFLSSLESEDKLQDNDISAMWNNVIPRVQQGEDFLSRIKFRVEGLSKSVNERKLQEVIQLCTLYVKVATLRSSLVWRMYSIINTKSKRQDKTPNNFLGTLFLYLSSLFWGMLSLFHTKSRRQTQSPAAKALFEVIKHDNKIHEKFLTLLTKPTSETIRLHSYFRLSNHKDIAEFAKTKGAKFQNLSTEFSEGNFVFRTEQWFDTPLRMSSMPFRQLWMPFRQLWTNTKLRKLKMSLMPFCKLNEWIKGKYLHIGKQNEFKLEVVSDLDNIFAIRSCRWPDLFVGVYSGYICRGSKGNTEKLDDSMKWKILLLENGFCVICSVMYPNYIAYIEGIFGFMRVKDGYPDKACFWKIEKSN